MMDLKLFAIQAPKKGSKFVAFWHDGSGATLFIRLDDGSYLEGDGEPYAGDFFESGYHSWEYLPDSFELWFEQRGEATQ